MRNGIEELNTKNMCPICLLSSGGKSLGDAPDFVEVGEVGIAVDDAMRHQRCLQLVC